LLVKQYDKQHKTDELQKTSSKARTAIDEALKLWNDEGSLYYLRAELQILSRGSLASMGLAKADEIGLYAAIGDLDQAIKYSPDKPKYYLRKAEIYCYLRSTALAIGEIKKANALGAKKPLTCKQTF